MAVSNKMEENYEGKPQRPILRFLGNEKVGRIPNEKFPLVIIETISNFNMTRILNEGGNSCDIMYSKLFEKPGLKREKLWPYEGSYLQAFNNTVTCLWGYAKLMVTLGEGIDTITIDI